MLNREDIMEIKVLARQGHSIREIARKMQVSRNTVRRYLRDELAAAPKRPAQRPQKLDPFRSAHTPHIVTFYLQTMELTICRARSRIQVRLHNGVVFSFPLPRAKNRNWEIFEYGSREVTPTHECTRRQGLPRRGSTLGDPDQNL